MKALVSFLVGLKLYGLKIFPSDDRVELQDEAGETLLVFTSDLDVIGPEGKVGDIRIETVDGSGAWVYYERPLQTRIVFGDDLFEAEKEISKRFIARTGLSFQ